MTLTEEFEEDRERLSEELEAAADPVRVQAVLGAELDRLLFRYNEECPDEEERRAASCMMQTARMALSLTDTAGEVKVWERRPADGRERVSGSLAGLPLILLAVSAVCAVLVLAVSVGQAASPGIGWIATSAVLLAAAVILARVSGRMQERPADPAGKGRLSRKRKKKTEEGYAGTGKADAAARRVEISADPQKLCRALRGILLTIDRNLADIRLAAGKERGHGTDQGLPVDRQTMDLCAGLLEASASGDAGFAMERLQDVKYYLHGKGIDTVPYSGEHEEWFDLLPGEKTETVRPALAADGRLLKKGLAVGGR